METLKLYNLAEKSGITVDRFSLPENGSVSLLPDGKLYIALASNIKTNAEERVCLAHELGHCETLGFYNMYAPIEVRSKHENKADRWAIKRLVPEEKYRRALRNGYTDINSLAEFFDVTDEFMEKAVQYYSKNQI